MKRVINLTPATLKRMIREERRKILREKKQKKAKKSGMINDGKNKYNPYTKRSNKSGAKEVNASQIGNLSKIVNAAQKLNEHEKKLQKKIKLVKNIRNKLKNKIIKDL